MLRRGEIAKLLQHAPFVLLIPTALMNAVPLVSIVYFLMANFEFQHPQEISG
jgi:hypothetical protein